MKRTGPPERRTELARGEGPRRRTPLRQVSDKRKAEAPVRAEVRAAVLFRDGYRCQLRGHGDCQGGLEVHEVVRRSQEPGSHLDAGLCVTLCSRHHEMDRHRVLAESLGIRVPGWAFDRYGMRVVAEAKLIRARWRIPGQIVPAPSWWE